MKRCHSHSIPPSCHILSSRAAIEGSAPLSPLAINKTQTPSSGLNKPQSSRRKILWHLCMFISRHKITCTETGREKRGRSMDKALKQSGKTRSDSLKTTMLLGCDIALSSSRKRANIARKTQNHPSEAQKPQCCL